MKELPVNKIIEGDCIEVLKTLQENSVDAIVTDPPAGISFMGKEWDNHQDLQGFQNFICQAFTEVIRVLKPGGHALVWAIPRTSHHTATGLERAGFEIRDVITHIFGSGFPKSLNIGKAVDKIQGNKREEIKKIFPDGSKPRKTQHINFYTEKNGIKGGAIYTKGTSEFEGLGTALKPAVEFWWLCRKPISEPTIAENCIKWGTGGLSIDECRIGLEGGGTHCDNRDEKGNCLGHKNAGRSTSGETIHPSIDIISVHNAPKGTFAGGEENRGSDTESYRNHQGRFPANLILTCLCDEVKEGKEFVSGSFPEERGETAFFGLNKKHRHRVGQVKDKAIIHTNPNCPCYILDKQSGERKGWSSQNNSPTNVYGGNSFNPSATKLPAYRDGFNDIGGAARFFYQAKPSRAERNMGCEGLEEKKMDEGGKEGNPGGDNPRNRGVNPQTNFHPTVKSISLMSYLIKLVSREGQIVCDPFAGSGSTLIAAKQLKRNYIGIEKDESYCKIAEARLKSLPQTLF